MSLELVPKQDQAGRPPILAGRFTPDVKQRVEYFYFSVAS